MQTRSSLTGALVGGALGATLGYLFLTEAGQRRREVISREFERLSIDYQEVMALWRRLQGIAERYRSGPADAFLADIADALKQNPRRSLDGVA
jgi:gas vesicle protein